MHHAGLDETVWRQLLQHETLLIRLCALRTFAQAGEVGARALLTGPTFDRPHERYPWVWALSRCVSPETFRHLPAHGLVARVRFLVRRADRVHRWPRPLSREACVEALMEANHPMQILACAVRLLEQHGERAIPALLEVLRVTHLHEDKAECAAWALGRVGRVAVPETVHCYKGASPRVRRHLAIALWYLGPEAVKAVPVLLPDKSEQATAALLSMEDRASVAMIAEGRGPIWLDEQAVRCLAEIAFSEQPRAFAAASLGGFGPAAFRATPILKHLARDPDVEVRRMLARGLAWGGRSDAFLLLLKLSDDEDATVRDYARRGMLALQQSPNDTRAALLRHFVQGAEDERHLAATQLSYLGLPSGLQHETRKALETANDAELNHLLLALAVSGEVEPEYQSIVLELLQTRLPLAPYGFARLLQFLPDSPAVRDACARVLETSDRLAVEIASNKLASTGAPLAELPVELGTLPVKSIATLLGALEPDQISARDLLPMFHRAEPEAQRAAAVAVGLLGTTDEHVLQTLIAGLHAGSDEVAASCAHALVRLGHLEHGWALLRASDPSIQQRAVELVQLSGDVSPVLQAFRSGRFRNSGAFRALKQLLTPELLVQLIEETLPSLIPPFTVTVLAGHLVAAGVTALARVPVWLVSTDTVLRELGFELLEQLLAPQEAYLDWVAENGELLPLDAPQIGHRLHSLLSWYLARAQSWGHPAMLPLWERLARSPLDDVAARALTALAKRYAHFPDERILQHLGAALADPEAVIRRTALREMRHHLPPELWLLPDSDSEERQLLSDIRLFLANQIDPLRLARLMEQIEEQGLDHANLLTPETPRQALLLLQVMPHSLVAAQMASRLLWAYSGPTTPAMWRELLRAARCESSFPADLAKRWPRLVVSALARWQDGIEWVLALGTFADDGLIAAVRDRRALVRERAMQVLERGGGSRRRRVESAVRAMAEEDESLRARARAWLVGE